MVGVGFGAMGSLSYGGVLGHVYGEDEFSLRTIQPIVFYNFAAVPGMYVGYNNIVIGYWSADSSDRRQVPLGTTMGRTLPMGDKGSPLDLSLGAYGLAARPTGGADWQLKFAVSLFFP